jgi:hypothetical protein
MFDASKEHADISPLWVRIPILPMEYWTKKSFTELGNALGSFVDVDMSFLEIGEMEFARILVSLDVREGFLEELNLLEYDGCACLTIENITIVTQP